MTKRRGRTTSDGGKQGPGRPRSLVADQAIIEATLALLAEVGYAKFTVQGVIARAGVSSATLYRRWSTKHELITAALGSLGPEPVTIDTGSLDTDLAAFVDYLAEFMTHPSDLAAAWSTAVADPVLHEVVVKTFVSPRKAMLAEILEQAHARGELASIPPLDDCWSFVSGPIHHRLYIRGEPFSAAFGRAVTTLLAAGIRALVAADTGRRARPKGARPGRLGRRARSAGSA